MTTVTRTAALVVGLLIPSVAGAQETVARWSGLNVSRLSTVYVLDDTGVEAKGTLLGFDRESVLLLVDGAERRFDASHVARIDRRGDSLRNGAIIGAVAGGILGAVGAGVSDCPRADDDCVATRAVIFLFSTGVYAAVGAAIDALIPGRTTLYVAPSPPARELGIRGMVGVRAGLSLSVGW